DSYIPKSKFLQQLEEEDDRIKNNANKSIELMTAPTALSKKVDGFFESSEKLDLEDDDTDDEFIVAGKNLLAPRKLAF
ncbi:MAG: hypothetical protein K2X39_08995, partial [Silvanigrellaceae bacterium]|nr:hypothetical protein [Silvanigrellaceae bacterium]